MIFIELYMTILGGYTDFTRQKYVKRKKVDIVSGTPERCEGKGGQIFVKGHF